MIGQMDLANTVPRDIVEEIGGIDTVIIFADIGVIDIEQQVTPGSRVTSVGRQA